MTEGQDRVNRCGWAVGDEMIAYHDREWGRPVHDDRLLFEMLILEGKQAGLSWRTILLRRERLRAAFDHFNPERMAVYDEMKVASLLQNEGIIRNRLKVSAAITNAQAYLKLCDEFGSLDRFLWTYVDGKPILNARKKLEDIPARTPLSDKISADLKKRGFKFVGSTIIYAFMQAVGMVNDHLLGCDCYPRS